MLGLQWAVNNVLILVCVVSVWFKNEDRISLNVYIVFSLFCLNGSEQERECIVKSDDSGRREIQTFASAPPR